MISIFAVKCQVARQDVITLKVAVEAIFYVYQNNSSGRTKLTPPNTKAYYMVWSIAYNTMKPFSAVPTTPTVPHSTANRLHAPSAMYLGDLRQW